MELGITRSEHEHVFDRGNTTLLADGFHMSSHSLSIGLIAFEP